ncbi:MAG TPA: sialidase family protein [Cyclobacteriaceae bacterium]|nr:sialidase family protein [Cyclobacteriaceae bacterium]
MRKFLFVFPFFVISFCSLSQFKNIKLAEQLDDGRHPPIEPSIAINRNNPQNIVAGIMMDRVVTSGDGGTTWAESKLNSPFGVYGNPAVVSNAKGNLFYFHLADPSGKGSSDEAWLDRIVCQPSIDEGKTWLESVSIGNNPPADQIKAWPAVQPKKNFMCLTWTQFDKYGSKDANCQSNILFSKSNNGNRWSTPVQISESPGNCADDDFTAKGAVPVIGTDGKIYVAWTNRGNIYFDRSYDEGNSWLRNDLLIAKQEGGWTLEIPGLKKSNGLPVLAIDNSDANFHGTLYLVWADQRNGKDDTDIWLIRSTNRGDYWAKLVRVNADDSRTHQFLPWIKIDPTNGHVYIVYYDRRNYNDNQTDVYLSYSFDGGNSFKEVKISETPFIPDSGEFLGDHTNIDAYGGIITPIWTRMDNGKTSVWTVVIKDSELAKLK